ncbi:hypothetical protein Dimus_018472 [Dionaea muscipula]
MRSPYAQATSVHGIDGQILLQPRGDFPFRHVRLVRLFGVSLICNMDEDCEKLLICNMDEDCEKLLRHLMRYKKMKRKRNQAMLRCLRLLE